MLTENIMTSGHYVFNSTKSHQRCTNLLGGVHAEGVHDVSQEEEVELALAIPVVDVADSLDS